MSSKKSSENKGQKVAHIPGRVIEIQNHEVSPRDPAKSRESSQGISLTPVGSHRTNPFPVPKKPGRVSSPQQHTSQINAPQSGSGGGKEGSQK
jgi:hypothetical protein